MHTTQFAPLIVEHTITATVPAEDLANTDPTNLMLQSATDALQAVIDQSPPGTSVEISTVIAGGRTAESGTD